MIKVLIGVAIVLVGLIIGYNLGYKDGEREMFDFINEICPSEMEQIVRTADGIREDYLNRYKKDGK